MNQMHIKSTTFKQVHGEEVGGEGSERYGEGLGGAYGETYGGGRRTGSGWGEAIARCVFFV